MAFVGKTSISLPTLNLYKTHTKFKNYNNATIAERPKFCKTCYKPCLGICLRTLARYKAQLNTWQSHGRSDNFVFVSARYIMEFYKWMNENDFLRSIIASAILFAIGMKLTGEINTWNLPQFVVPQ
ncbi:hypothetical protein ACFW04_009548 [Cataglyphis niger]